MAGVTLTSSHVGGFMLTLSPGNRIEAVTGLIDNGYAANLRLGDPIQIDADGYITALSTVNAEVIDGVFLGCEYQNTDAYNVQHFRKNWVSGTTTKGSVDVKAQYIPAKGNRFEAKVKAGQTLTEAYIGDYKNVTAASVGAGDSYGNSLLTIDLTTTPADAAASAVLIVDTVKDAAGNVIAAVVEFPNANL